MILHTTEVIPLPHYRLFLRFNNGEAGEVDLSDELDGEVFEALRDPSNATRPHPPKATLWNAVVRSAVISF